MAASFAESLGTLLGLNLYGLNLVVGTARLGMAARSEHYDVCKQSQRDDNQPLNGCMIEACFSFHDGVA